MDLDLQFQTLLDLALREEGQHDVTSEALFAKGDVKEAVVMSRGDGVICGLKFLQKIAKHCFCLENTKVKLWLEQ